MAAKELNIPAEVRRPAGPYRFISADRFAELGIDPQDVPRGTLPAQDHPPFLPDRYGGNAYGLGLVEHAGLRSKESRFLDTLDLADPGQVASHYRRLNDIFKRLGLLVRFSTKGKPFYLIPRRFLAHFMVEIKAQADQIVDFLSGLPRRKMREHPRVALLSPESNVLLEEVAARLPELGLGPLRSLDDLTTARGPFAAMVMVGDPRQICAARLAAKAESPSQERERVESYGVFLASRCYDLLEEGGELLLLGERPLGGSRETVGVRFLSQDEMKRFLLFSHIFRTRRCYGSEEGPHFKLNRFDFNSFLTGLFLYHQTVEGLLDRRPVAQVDPAEIDAMSYQNLPLPRGSPPQVEGAWRRWFSPFFRIDELGGVLPADQRRRWQKLYQVDGGLPHTLTVLKATRRNPVWSLSRLTQQVERLGMAGCKRALLADYKDTLSYVREVLGILQQIRQGSLPAVPGLELTRLRKPFESARRSGQVRDLMRLLDLAPRLAVLGGRLNPDQILGPRTPIIDNLEKLSLLGVEPEVLRQLYLIVTGHSAMSRVTFGKMALETLAPLTDLRRYKDLDEAVRVIRLYRLLSVAETAAASAGRLTPGQVRELFNLYDMAIEVVTDPQMDWPTLREERMARLGGARAMVLHKMLKLFNLFEHLQDWPRILAAGSRQKEVLADFDAGRLASIERVVALDQQMRSYVERHYASESSARPYFLRAFLSSEIHGSGRLLPALGPEAGFVLLWISVHLSERQLLNLNPLLAVEAPGRLTGRLQKIRKALAGCRPVELSPAYLSHMRRAIEEKGRAYLRDTGLHFSLDARTGALEVHFLDLHTELRLLQEDLAHCRSQDLIAVAPGVLANLDRRVEQTGGLLEALAEADTVKQRADQVGDPALLQRRLHREIEQYLQEQLFKPETFAQNLHRLALEAPHLLAALMPPAPPRVVTRRLAAAAKLSALFNAQLNSFQDMDLSHQIAQREFGADAAGVVGLSAAQFQSLCRLLVMMQDQMPHLPRLLMAAVLLGGQDQQDPAETPPLWGLPHRLGLGKHRESELRTLLRLGDLWRQMLAGEVSLAGIDELLKVQSVTMGQAVYLWGVISLAARREGLLSEDLMERLDSLAWRIRRWALEGVSAAAVQERHLKDHARQVLAFDQYRQMKGPTASLHHFVDTVSLPAGPSRELWLAEGRREAGLERLVHLKGLIFIDALDLHMLRQEVPLKFIYRLKGLHSMGLTHFERDLFEGMRLSRALLAMADPPKDFLLERLCDSQRPLRLVSYGQVAEYLSYANQVRILLAALAAAEHSPQAVHTVSFESLAQVMDRKFEEVNQAVESLNLAPEALPGLWRRLGKARQGLCARLAGGVLDLQFADPLNIDRRIADLHREKDPDRLKEIYHQELRRLKADSRYNLDHQQRLEEAFGECLERLGREMVEEVRRTMASENDLDRLAAIWEQAREEALALPLSPARLQNLDDLFELHLERIRSRLLAEAFRRIRATGSRAELDRLWRRVKPLLRERQGYLGKDFELKLAERFDRWAQKLD